MTSDPNNFNHVVVMASPITGRWKRVSSVPGLTNSSPRTPGVESTSTTQDIQSDFGHMDVADDNYNEESDVINRSERFHHRAASVDTGIPDNRKPLTKRKLDEYTNSTKDDLVLGNRSSRQSSSENSSNNSNDNRILHVATRFNRPLSVGSESSPIPAAVDSPRRHKTLKTHSESNLSQRSYHSYCSPSSASSSSGNDNFQQLIKDLPVFNSDEVWVTSRRAQFLWKAVQGEPHDRLLLCIDPCIALDADFGVKLTRVPMLVPTYDANGSKIYLRNINRDVSIFVVRQSSDRHPLFHHPRNKYPQRTSYHRQAKLLDNFSWVEETLVIGSVQLKIALLLHEQLAQSLFLRPVCDHPVYSQYLYRPDAPSVPLTDDQGSIIFTDIRTRQLLGVYQKADQKLVFLLDCLYTKDDNFVTTNPTDNIMNLPQSPTPSNVFDALLRGQAIRPQLQGEVYKARVLNLNAAQNIWVPTREEEYVCLKVSCLSNGRVLTHEEISHVNSDLRRFRPLLQNQLHTEDIVMDIQTMQFFASAQRPIPGFLQSLYVRCDGRHLFSATRFMPRGTLFDAWRKQQSRPFLLFDVQKIMRFILRQVYCMHCKGLAHGDLYLDNILVKDMSVTTFIDKSNFSDNITNANGLFANCEFLLMDFGQCRSTSTSTTPSTSPCNMPTSAISNDNNNNNNSDINNNTTSTNDQPTVYHVPDTKGKFVCFTPESIAVHSVLKNPQLTLSHKKSIVDAITCETSLTSITKKDAMERSDVWQLGVMLFMLLTGREPFSMIARGPHQTRGGAGGSAMGDENMRREKLLSWFKMLNSGHHTKSATNNSIDCSSSNSSSSSNSLNPAVPMSLRELVTAMRQQSRNLPANPHITTISTNNKINNNNINNNSSLSCSTEDTLPDEVWSLLEAMLHCDPLKRPSVQYLLNHPFLSMSLNAPPSILNNDINTNTF